MPGEWQEMALGDVAATFDGSMVDGPFGSNLKSAEYTPTGVRLIQLQNIGDGYWKNDNAAYISPEKFATLRRHGARPGDIALAKMADPIARACIIPDTEQQYVVVADCIKLTVNQTRFEPSFIMRAINFREFRTQAERVGIGTTRQRVNLSQVRRLVVSVPTLPEQRRIAAILDTLDRTIEGTGRVIEKLQATRQGLLHDLLTRGLDENGGLRDPERNPEQFKETELGRVPVGWEVGRVEDFGEVRLGRQRSPQHQSGRYTTPYLRVANVFDGWIDYSDVLEMDFTPSERTVYRLLPGDILLNEGQSLHLVGRPAMYEGEPGEFC